MKTLYHYRGKPVRRQREDGVVEKLCAECKAWKPQDEHHFYFSAGRGAYQSQCIACQCRRVARASAGP